MEKFLLNVLQIAIILKIGYSLLEWMLSSKKRRRKSIAKKVWRLFVNKIHYHLDNALEKQRKALHSSKDKEVEYPSNVIPLRKTQ